MVGAGRAVGAVVVVVAGVVLLVLVVGDGTLGVGVEGVR